MIECGILPPSRMKPRDGCSLPINHDGPHNAVTIDGMIEWHNDLECDCDDCHSDDPADWCVVWQLVDG